jgi:hypothetical protein
VPSVERIEHATPSGPQITASPSMVSDLATWHAA